jgi:hypothetical protein
VSLEKTALKVATELLTSPEVLKPLADYLAGKRDEPAFVYALPSELHSRIAFERMKLREQADAAASEKKA